MAFPPDNRVYFIVEESNPKLCVSVPLTGNQSRASLQPIDEAGFIQQWHLQYAGKPVVRTRPLPDEQACILTEATQRTLKLGLKSVRDNEPVRDQRHAQCWILSGNADGYTIFQICNPHSSSNIGHEAHGYHAFNWKNVEGNVNVQRRDAEKPETNATIWKFQPVLMDAAVA